MRDLSVFIDDQKKVTTLKESGWLSNREKSFDEIYKKCQGDAVAMADMETWTRIDTATGIQFIGPTRIVLTGEVVVDGMVTFRSCIPFAG